MTENPSPLNTVQGCTAAASNKQLQSPEVKEAPLPQLFLLMQSLPQKRGSTHELGAVGCAAAPCIRNTHTGCRILPRNFYPRIAKYFPGASFLLFPMEKTKTGENYFLKVTVESRGRSKNTSCTSWPLAACSQTAPACNLACYQITLLELCKIQWFRFPSISRDQSAWLFGSCGFLTPGVLI